jgi:hypothetical protein
MASNGAGTDTVTLSITINQSTSGGGGSGTGNATVRPNEPEPPEPPEIEIVDPPTIVDPPGGNETEPRVPAVNWTTYAMLILFLLFCIIAFAGRRVYEQYK